MRSLCIAPIAALFASLALACGSGNDGSAPPPTNGGGSPMVPAVDGGNGHDGGDKDAGGPTAPPPFVSNPAGATFKDVGNPATPDLVLVSSNLLQDTPQATAFLTWYGEVQNVGTRTLCQIDAKVSFRDASGAEVASAEAFAKSDPYDSASGLVMPCIAPGKRGVFWYLRELPAAAAIDAVTTVAVAFTPNEYSDAKPAALAPSLRDLHVAHDGLYDVVGAAIGAAGGPVYNLSYEAFPRDARGVLNGHLQAFHLDTLAPGASWAIDAGGNVDPFTDFEGYVDFLDGQGGSSNQDPVVAHHRRQLEERRTAALDATLAAEAHLRALRGH